MASEIVGATINWSGDVVLCFSGGTVLPGKFDRIMFPEYYRWREDWPCEQTTGEPLEIWTGSTNK